MVDLASMTTQRVVCSNHGELTPKLSVFLAPKKGLEIISGVPGTEGPIPRIPGNSVRDAYLVFLHYSSSISSELRKACE